MESDLLKLIGEHFFGMTNFGDLQSITFANQYTKDYGYLFGLSFLDFSYFWISKIFWIDLELTSIGTRLTNSYFYHVDSGSPAPGIINLMFLVIDKFYLLNSYYSYIYFSRFKQNVNR